VPPAAAVADVECAPSGRADPPGSGDLAARKQPEERTKDAFPLEHAPFPEAVGLEADLEHLPLGRPLPAADDEVMHGLLALVPELQEHERAVAERDQRDEEPQDLGPVLEVEPLGRDRHDHSGSAFLPIAARTTVSHFYLPYSSVAGGASLRILPSPISGTGGG